jgi:hypothetical protein
MSAGQSPLGAATVAAMAVVGVRQHTGQVMVADGVQAGVVGITAPAMATHMLLAFMRHPWFTQRHQW